MAYATTALSAYLQNSIFEPDMCQPQACVQVVS